MARSIFQIENGLIGFKVVDTAAVGYLSTWQAPAGKTLTTVAMADYETSSTAWSDQVTSGALEATPSTTTATVPATFREAAEETPTPGVTTYDLVLSFLQDIHISTGLNKFLFQNDTDEAYYILAFDGTNPPMSIGRVRLAAAAMGGDARTPLTAPITLPLSRKPDIEFGNATTSTIVLGSA